MATLTYNPNEQAEGELTEEEQNSLEVGEKMQAEQDQLLAGKFKDAEELEKGYIELQKKLGAPEEKAEEEVTYTKDEKVETEDEKPDPSFLDTLWEEATNDKFTKETMSKLGEMKPEDVAQMYLQYRQDSESNRPEPQTFTEDNVKDLKDIAGGDEGYTAMLGWAKDNLKKAEIDMYDQVMDQGNPLAAFFAVQALKYRFDDAKGVDGQMLQGKAPTSSKDVFQSQAQVVKAMTDERYEKDPAYRQEIYDKLERSNLQF